MLPGYSTNTISELDGIDSVENLASMGYSSLAITLDRHVLNPYRVDFEDHVTRWANMLHRCGFASVIETGARYLLDSQQKHEPTLMSQDPTARQKRIDFLRSSIDVASSLKSTCVSLWSGVVRDSAVEETLWKRLLSSIEPVLEYAHEKNVAVALEPEPGMFIDSLHRYKKLTKRLMPVHPLSLTIDTGHLVCMGELHSGRLDSQWTHKVINVHLDDMRACRHDHLPLGTGDVPLESLLQSLFEAGYKGGLHVEIPRQSHLGLAFARTSKAAIDRLLERIQTKRVVPLTLHT